MGAYVDAALPRLMVRREGPAFRNALAIAHAQSPVGLAGALAALRDRPDALPGLGAIAVPTTVVVGAEDTVTPPEVARGLARAIPGAELVEIPGAGHLSNLDAPEAFLRVLESLLLRV
jgi:pimeloyl-ACP methyl ester carboxylesterase